MPSIDTVVIGAGHAGLAVSRCLTTAGRDHLVLDRARLAESWRSSRWDSLRLLTPNWMTRLPSWRYQGADSLKPAAGVTVLYAPRRTVLDRVLADTALAAGGSACHAGNHESSPVLSAMSVPEDSFLAAIRLSLGRWTTDADVEPVAAALVAAATPDEVRGSSGSAHLDSLASASAS